MNTKKGIRSCKILREKPIGVLFGKFNVCLINNENGRYHINKYINFLSIFIFLINKLGPLNIKKGIHT